MGKIILIVIDFERIREFIKGALEKKGYKVIASDEFISAVERDPQRRALGQVPGSGMGFAERMEPLPD